MEMEASAVAEELVEIKRKVDGYTKKKYDLYLEAKERSGPTLKRELNKWFFVDKKLINDLQSKIEEHAPPDFSHIWWGTIEFTSLLKDPSKWPIADSVWIKEFKQRIESRVATFNNRIAALEREISRREEAKARKAAEDAKLVYAAERKARMKNLSNDSRSEGYGLRRLLPKNHPCPYCSGPLGHSPRADHIYPIHKGGRSTFANMVYICNDCNSKKGKMTLQQFIKKFKLNREQIEKTLLALNKEF
jgi:5-methylcytosine-specific restriction endonuclease McrA